MFKEATFISSMIVLIFAITLFWNWLQGKDECQDSNLKRSIKYTMFISLILVLFYLGFEWAWKRQALKVLAESY